jgi:hypothetical protein
MAQSIRDIMNVRDAWQKVAESESSTTEQARERRMQQHLLERRQSSAGMSLPPDALAASNSNRWSA